MRAVLFSLAALVIFTVFAVVYAASAPAKDVRVLPKWLWVTLALIATPVGGALYLVFGRPLPKPGQPSRGGKSLAPDDDPDFLRNLRDRLSDDEDGSTK